MRRSLQERDSQVQVALGLALLALLLLALIIGSGSPAPASQGKPPTLAAQLTAAGQPAAERRSGRRGKRGPRGPRGPEGREGPQGAQGIAAGPARQFVSIDWQNGEYSGHDRQTFTAPGIGTGEVRCTPPNEREPTGVQWIRFYPYDAPTATSGPSRWNTTMWTVRNGGNIGQNDGDPTDSAVTVVRTARIDRAGQGNGFNESMNTQTVGYDVRSTGMFTGLITTEPLTTGISPPSPTSFRLSWHWNFGLGYDNPHARCYMAGTFVTKGT